MTAQTDISAEAVKRVGNALPAGGAGMDARQLLHALRSALTASEKRAEDLHDKLYFESNIRQQVETALTGLTVAANKVADVFDGLPLEAVDALPESLEDLLHSLEEAIPCKDCISAPCRCPNV